MTHFTVAVIVPSDVEDIYSFIEEQMQPFDENTEVELHVCYSLEKAAADLAAEIHRLELILGREEKGWDIEELRKELDMLHRMTPPQRYREWISSHDLFNAKGEPVSTYNPKSKWDWYVIGGRWDGWVNDREATGERLKPNMAATAQMIERNKIPHAIITPDGKWHERGRMGWWGLLLSENEHWDEEARRLFAQHPDARVVIVDAHI